MSVCVCVCVCGVLPCVYKRQKKLTQLMSPESGVRTPKSETRSLGDREVVCERTPLFDTTFLSDTEFRRGFVNSFIILLQSQSLRVLID